VTRELRRRGVLRVKARTKGQWRWRHGTRCAVRFGQVQRSEVCVPCAGSSGRNGRPHSIIIDNRNNKRDGENNRKTLFYITSD
jgi:hypothetical protein